MLQWLAKSSFSCFSLVVHAAAAAVFAVELQVVDLSMIFAALRPDVPMKNVMTGKFGGLPFLAAAAAAVLLVVVAADSLGVAECDVVHGLQAAEAETLGAGVYFHRAECPDSAPEECRPAQPQPRESRLLESRNLRPHFVPAPTRTRMKGRESSHSPAIKTTWKKMHKRSHLNIGQMPVVWKKPLV